MSSSESIESKPNPSPNNGSSSFISSGLIEVRFKKLNDLFFYLLFLIVLFPLFKIQIRFFLFSPHNVIKLDDNNNGK